MNDLNEWIARNVMGWQEIDGHWCAQDGAVCAEVESWRPDSDIADAWLVVEKMRAQKWYCTIRCLIGTDLYSAHFDDMRSAALERNSNIALAICLAAKKAIEEAR